MLFPLPGEPAEVTAENAPTGVRIGDRHFFPALAAPEGTAHLRHRCIPGVLPVKSFTMGGAEFLSPVIQTGHLHKLSAMSAGKAPQDRPAFIFCVRPQLLPIGQALTGCRAEAPAFPVGGKGFPAHFTILYHSHSLRRALSFCKQAHKKGRTQNSLCIFLSGHTNPRRYSFFPLRAQEVVLPPPHLYALHCIMPATL